MKLLTVDREDAPDCKPGESISFKDVAGTVVAADDSGVTIQVESVGEKTYEEPAADDTEEVEEDVSPEVGAVLKSRNKKKK